MKKIFLILLVAVSGIFTLKAADVKKSINWKSDFKAAQKQSSEEKKPLLLLFTGSDWCPACIQMKKEVFENEQFKKLLSTKVIPIYLDYPRTVKQSEEQKTQNRKLLLKFMVRAFPTTMIVNTKGEVTGSIEGFDTVKDYLKQLEKLISK